MVWIPAPDDLIELKTNW